jgi:PAS domain S-box-containing protein
VIVWADLSIKAVRNSQGNVECVIETFTDITKFKQIEQELAARISDLSFHRDAIDQHALVSITDVRGEIVYVNDGFCAISGYSREDLLGANHRILKSDFHGKETYTEMWETISNGEVWHGEFQNKKKDGVPYWVQASIIPRLGDDGKPAQYLSIQTDITERKQTSEAYRENLMMLEKLLEQTREGYWRIDNGAITTGLNQTMCEILGREEKDVIGKHIFDFVDQKNKDIFIKQVQLRAEGHRGTYEISLSRPDGEQIPCINNATPLYDQQGRKQGAVGLFTRVDALKKAQHEAELANKAKSDFLSRMSHELRTPLNSILGFSQILKKSMSQLDDEVLRNRSTEQIEVMLASGNHLLDLVDEVLDLARIESGHMSMSLEDVSLRKLLSDVMAMSDPLPSKHNMDVTIDLIDRNLDQYLRVDPTRIRQILINLVSNAVKYNRQNGSVKIEVSAARQGMCVIEVTDSGFGLTQSQQRKLFEPFERLGAENTEIEGTGIGLSLTKYLIEALNGEIGFDTKEGEGSKFWVSVPVTDTEPNSKQSQANSIKEVLLNYHGKQILYIEDTPSNIHLLESFFYAYPELSLVSAIDGKSGIALADQIKPDVILLDMNLPDMTGYDIYKVLAQDSELRKIPVSILSANVSEEIVNKSKAIGIQNYLTKPIDLNHLVAFLNEQFADKA